MKIKKVAIMTGVLGATILGGFYTGANVDWQTEVVNDASAKIGKAGFDKKEELLNNNSIGDQMKSVLAPTIEEEQKELERLLEEYYQMKIQGLTDTPEFLALEKQIEQIRLSVLNRYKKEIDAAFEGS